LSPEAVSAYRTAPPPRTLVVRLGYAWRTTIISAVLALSFLAAAGVSWFSHSTVDIRHNKWVGSACAPEVEQTRETVPVTAVTFIASVRHTGSWDSRVVATDLSPRRGAIFLVVMALVAFIGPRIMTEHATLTLDEGDRRVRLVRNRFGVERVSRPLEDLVEAVLVTDEAFRLTRGWGTRAQLVFHGGERIDVAAPTNGDAGQAALVAKVNEFLAARRIPSSS
jgi:hypothetical protein